MMLYKTKYFKFSLFLSPKEVLISFIILLVSGLSTSQLYELHNTSLITASKNVYFQADLGRTYSAMSSRVSEAHYRAKVHPLLPIQTHSPVFLLKKLGFSTFTAVKIVVCTIASIWGLCLYGMFRLIGNSRFHAILLTILGLSSASAMFWLSVPESYALGSLNIIIALCFAALANCKPISNTGYILLNIITLSTTITNWMSGVAATFAGRSTRETIKLCLISLALVTILWGVQKHFFYHTVFFLGDSEEASYMFAPSLARVAALVSTFFFHAVISPAINIIDHNIDGWPLISFQSSMPASSNLIEMAGSLLWICTLTISAIGFFKLKAQLPLRITLGLTILGQLFLHLLYGEEIFLYSLHFLPLLLALVSIGLNTKNSKLIVGFITLLIPILFISNLQKFESISEIAIPPAQEVKNQMLLKPNDPWPREEGDVISANPSRKVGNKSYYETGGSLRPAGQKYACKLELRQAES